MCGATPSERIPTKLGTCVRLTDVIKLAEFHHFNLRGFGAVTYWSFHVAIGSKAVLNTRLSATALQVINKKEGFDVIVVGFVLGYSRCFKSQAGRQCLAVLMASAVVVLKHVTSTLCQSHNFISIDFKFGVYYCVREVTSPAKFSLGPISGRDATWGQHIRVLWLFC